MGGRGSNSRFSWKNQLKNLAKEDKMPSFLIGPREQQAQMLEEIDKLYSVPDTSGIRVIEGETDVRAVLRNGQTILSRYPSGQQASEAERRGALKFLLYNRAKK